MDAKELRGESALAERSSDGATKFAHTAPALQYERAKPCPELGPSTFKADGQGARPCAVIGPDRKKAPVEPWLSSDSLYRRPPDYPHKMSEYQDPTRNISPRQTFQENMQRIIMPPGYNTLKVNEDPAYATKNTKLNVPLETKYCDVPYNVNPNSGDQKNHRNSEHSVSNVNPLLVRTVPHGWPPGSVSVRPLRPYGAPDVYQFPDYACSGPRLPLPRPHASSHDEPSLMYPEAYYHEGNIRYKPYPNIKERYPQTRYEYLGNYSNPYPSPHPFAPPKYELPKPMPNHPYPSYPQPTLKYTDRVPEPVMDSYQRSFNQQGNYGVPFRNPVIHPPYRPVPGNPMQTKLHPYPSDGSNKSTISNKLPYDPNNKIYVDYDNSRPKAYPVNDNFYLSEMSRPYHTKNSIILPNYAPTNIQGVNQHPYIHLKNYEYARFKSLDPSIVNNPLTKVPMQFSPSTLAISPAESNASNDTIQTHGTSQEDCGYVSQSSIASGRSIDNRMPMDIYGRHDYRFSPVVRGSSLTRPDPNSNQMLKSKKDIRQFISSWNEGDDENVEGSSKRDVSKTISMETNSFPKQFEHVNNQEQLYVLGLVNVPSEELGKYEHIQKVSKLPENIKGYNSLELLNQFEEAIESSNINNPPVQKELQIPIQNMTHIHDALPRAVSPLDVEAKISQSVIHKEVGCNFEIKPCSPKMLNVQMATPVQTIFNERVIEKVANPQSRKSPIILQHANDNIDSALNKKAIKYPLINTASSCKMINNQLLSEASIDHLKTNYSLQDLENNLGVCLASLPRLDNDIELNFPEVNQQFINANKTESVITKSFSKDLPALDLERTDTNSIKMNAASEFNMSCAFSPKAKIDSDKECSRLSKYRKLKKSITDESDLTEAKAQATRVDSVIIKNPDNIRMYEDSTDTFRSGGYPKKDSQEYAINLATQAKNSQAQSELDKNVITPNRCENIENHSPSFVMHPKADNVFGTTFNVIEAKNNNEVDMQTEHLTKTYKDVSNRYIDKAALDMPMNLSPHTKYSVGVDEDLKINKNNDIMIDDTRSEKNSAISSPGNEYSLEELKHRKSDDVDKISSNSDTRCSPKAEEHGESRSKSETTVLDKTENTTSSLNFESQVLVKAEHIESSLNSDATILDQTEECSLSKSNSDEPVLSKEEEHTVSSLIPDTTVLSKTETCTASKLNSDNPTLPKVEEHTESILCSDSLFLPKTEACTISGEECGYTKNKTLRHPDQNELDLSTVAETESIEHPLSSESLNIGVTSTIRTLSKSFDESSDIINNSPLHESRNDNSVFQNQSSLDEQKSNVLTQNDMQVKYVNGVEVYVPKLRRNQNSTYISRRKRNTDSLSAAILKDKVKLNRKKRRFLQNSSNKKVGKQTFHTQQVKLQLKTTNDNSHENSDISEKNTSVVNLMTSSPMTVENHVHFSDDREHTHISDLGCEDTEANTTMVDLSVKIENRNDTNTNIHKDNVTGSSLETMDLINESLIFVTPTNKTECNRKENNTFDNEVKKRESSILLGTNAPLINETIGNIEPKQVSLKSTEKTLDTENPTIHHRIRKELFSPRFQNLLACNEGLSNKTNLSKTFQIPGLQNNDYNDMNDTTRHVSKQEKSLSTDVLLKSDENDGSNPIQNIRHLNNHAEDYTKQSATKGCFITEINQNIHEKKNPRQCLKIQNALPKNTIDDVDEDLVEKDGNIDEINSPRECFKIQNKLPKNIIDDANEKGLIEKDGGLKDRHPLNSTISSNAELKSNNCEYLEKSRESINETCVDDNALNCKVIFKAEKNNDLHSEIPETCFDERNKLEICTNTQMDISGITHALGKNINEKQKQDHKIISAPLTNRDELTDSLRKLSDSPRFFLKRSLSDSALDVYDGNAESTERKCLLLPKKRMKCFNSDNIDESHFLDIIQNSRRNSISTLCNENNISFCILIDDNCIIAEENYDQEDSNLDNTERNCLNDTQEENCDEITANSSANFTQWEEEKSWFENVGYEEIIDTEDIAENIIIGGPTSPKDIDSSDYESDDGDMGILSSAEIDHTNKVKHIYGDNMCVNDSELVDALYRTPQMDVNKKLMDRESQITEKTKYYDSDSLEMLLAEPISSHQLRANKSDPQLRARSESEETPGNGVNGIQCQDHLILSVIHTKLPDAENIQCSKSSTSSNENETRHSQSQSCEPSLDPLFSYEQKEEGSCTTCTSSSPEVSSTTSEENNSSLLKISKYKESRISEVNTLSHMHIENRKENSCKFTEKEYLNPNFRNNSHRPLITKAAQKYIPPLKETIPDLKVKLTLPQKSLLKLKESKVSKEEPKFSTRNLCLIPKKVKPKFEDVLKNIDEVQFKKHKDNNKKSRKSIPKVVIKKTGNGSHYASSSAKTSFNPDLTGRKWQPWVFIEKNLFVDKMALRNKTKAVFSHRKKSFVLDEKHYKYKSISSAKFIISQPKLNDFSTGNLKYTIKLKHSY